METTKAAYLKNLHDLAYVANLADSDCAESWQNVSHVWEHVNPILEIVKSLLSNEEYQVFLDCFGDFDSFLQWKRINTQ